jgi:hypothetical protein
MLLSGRAVRMQVVDARSHPGSQPVRPTIPSVEGGLLPSGREPWCGVPSRSRYRAPRGHRGSPTHEPPVS